MEFIDSHAHLTDPAFDADRDEVIGRARASGARAVVCIASNATDAAAARDLSAVHPGFLRFTSGVHPHEASAFDPVASAAAIREHARSGAVAIGECGLDYHYDNSLRSAQRAAFEAQISLASETGLPLVVHCREAASDMVAMIGAARSAGVRGVLHCFTGPRELGETALAAGWYLSFSGIVTFPRFDGDELIRMVPAGRLLVESDSPYLAPVPHRGRRNEPSFITLTVERLARTRETTPAALGAETAANAARFFSLEGGGAQ